VSWFQAPLCTTSSEVVLGCEGTPRWGLICPTGPLESPEPHRELCWGFCGTHRTREPVHVCLHVGQVLVRGESREEPCP
jgi:hypothetical protein